MRDLSLYVKTFILGLMVVSAFGCTQSKKETHEIPENSEVKNRDVKIDYNLCGNGDTTLLFIHGWAIDQSYWSGQVEAMCQYYTVVTMDVPGFGRSGKNRKLWSIEKYGEDVIALIDQLDLENVVLIGHSMGGDIILEAALQDTERIVKLIGVDNFKDVGATYGPAEMEEINNFMALLSTDFKSTIAGYAESVLFHSSTDSLVKTRVINDMQSQDSLIAINSLQALIRYAGKETGQLSQLKQPLILINSDATPTDTAGLNKTNIRYEIIPIHATGHYPMIEKPDEFNRLLQKAIVLKN